MKIQNKMIATIALCAVMAVPSFAQDDMTADTVLASVNGTEITLGHVIALTSRLPDEYQSIPEAELYKGILDQLIQQTLLSEQAPKESKRLQIAQDNELRALFATEGIEQILREKLSDEAIKAVYDSEFATASGETEFNASHILVETEEEAKALIEALNGGADFAELAKEKSTGPSGPNGGQLGWFGKGRMVPEFETAVMSMEKDGVSAPVQTQFGWHVVKLNDVREVEPPTLEEVRNVIEDKLRGDIIKESVEELEANSKIERTELEFDPSLIRKIELLGD